MQPPSQKNCKWSKLKVWMTIIIIGLLAVAVVLLATGVIPSSGSSDDTPSNADGPDDSSGSGTSKTSRIGVDISGHNVSELDLLGMFETTMTDSLGADGFYAAAFSSLVDAKYRHTGLSVLQLQDGELSLVKAGSGIPQAAANGCVVSVSKTSEGKTDFLIKISSKGHEFNAIYEKPLQASQTTNTVCRGNALLGKYASVRVMFKKLEPGQSVRYLDSSNAFLNNSPVLNPFFQEKSFRGISFIGALDTLISNEDELDWNGQVTLTESSIGNFNIGMDKMETGVDKLGNVSNQHTKGYGSTWKQLYPIQNSDIKSFKIPI